jgi:protein O-mannosyl-transferase
MMAPGSRPPRVVGRSRKYPARGQKAASRGLNVRQAASDHRRFAAAVVCALLLLGVALVFGQSLGHDFVNYDDDQYVYDNRPVAGGFTLAGIAWAFTEFHSSNWHPLTWLSHMLDCQVYGLDHPGGHHLTNILLHAANSVLLFLVLRRMTTGLWPSAFVAALFAVHPLHVESVAWVSERKDMLSGLFFMLTLAAYLRYVRHPFSLLRYLLVTFLFALGLLAKPMLVTMPFLLLLLDYWPLGRVACRSLLPPRGYPGTTMPSSSSGHRNLHAAESTIVSGYPLDGRRDLLALILEKLPWLALAAASCVMTYWAQGTAVIAEQKISFPSRVANALVSCAAYLGQFVFPAGLAAFYPHPLDSLPVWKIAAAGLLLAGISLTVFAVGRKCPYLAVGWLWFLGMLVPVSGLVQVGLQAMADRYTYLTQIGLYIALAWGAEQFSSRGANRNRVVAAAAALVVAAAMCCAWQQTFYWRDSETLWRRSLARSPESPIGHGNLGRALAKRGRLDEAIDEYKKALAILPDYIESHGNLADALAVQNKFDEAIKHYEDVIRLSPLDNRVYVQLGVAWARQEKLPEAEDCFRKALRLNPSNAEACYDLAKALQQQGKTEGALAQYQETLRLNPDQPDALNDLAWILATNPEPKYRDGPRAVKLAQRVGTRSAAALNTLAAAYAEAGMFSEAVQTARQGTDLARRQNQPALAEIIQARVRLYEAGRAYREPQRNSNPMR